MVVLLKIDATMDNSYVNEKSFQQRVEAYSRHINLALIIVLIFTCRCKQNKL
jgi:hypothetical protein